MAHILFISSYFAPEKAAAAVCVGESATRLAKLGHQVTVLTTFPNYPTGIVEPEYRGRRAQIEMIDGVRVVRVWSFTSSNDGGFLRRVLAQTSFGVLGPLLGARLIGRPDVIIINSPPLFNAIGGRLLAWLKRRPYIFAVADLWPESAVQLGMLRNRTAIKLAEWLERATYQHASFIWVVTAGVREVLLKRGIAPERIFLLTNGVDTHKFHPIDRAVARAQLGWDDRFTVVYAGNHGLVYGMTTVLDAAELLREESDIHFRLIGDGAQKAALVSEAQQRNLSNVTFTDPIAHDRMPLVTAAADVCLIPLSKMPLLQTSYPIKMFEIMACERPFILADEGISAALVNEAEAGICVEPENAAALVAAIERVRANPEDAGRLGRQGRAYVQPRFDYDALTATLHQRLSALV